MLVDRGVNAMWRVWTGRRQWPSMISVVTLLLGFGIGSASAVETQLAAAEDFGDLSLDALLEIEVVTVSKKAEPIGRAAAAVDVITGEMIRQSGARNIAEALRLVPGVHVARNNAQAYSVSIRGFASTSSDKLEVLIDGRSAYTPLFSGVFWETFDTFLSDVERIEVVRGPGGTLWGANAVNGVINIVTKPAQETLGVDATIGGGTERRGLVAIRQGAQLGGGAIRLYTKAYELDSSQQASGGEALDGQRYAQFGLRGDWSLGAHHSLTVIADGFGQRGTSADPLTGDEVETDADGASLNLRWARDFGEDAGLSAALYGEQTRRETPGTFAEDRDTIDFSLQYNTALLGAHTLVAGAGYRRSSDDTGSPPDVVIFDPQDRTVEKTNVFVMGQFAIGSRVNLSVGSKFEDGDLAGSEVQPGARLGVVVSDDAFFWSSIARAVRTPNRLDQDVAIFCPEPDGIIGVCAPGRFKLGNPDFESETLVAYEMGWRQRLADTASVDVALFHNDYDDLRSQEVVPPPFGTLENHLEGTGSGGEINLNLDLSKRWNMQIWYAYLDLDINAKSGSTDTTTARQVEQASPRHQAGAQLQWNDGGGTAAHLALRHVSRLDSFSVPSYTEADLTVIRKLSERAELRLIGRNLLDDQHREFGSPSATGGTALERAGIVELGLAWD